MQEIIKILMDKLDNDTLIVIGLMTLALSYSFREAHGSEQVVSNIVSIFGGYIGGQYVSTKK